MTRRDMVSEGHPEAHSIDFAHTVAVSVGRRLARSEMSLNVESGYK
jgi:hypothetical protein